MRIEEQLNNKDRARAGAHSLLHPVPDLFSKSSGTSEERMGPAFTGKEWPKKGTPEWWQERLEGAEKEAEYWKKCYPYKIFIIEQTSLREGGYVVREI